MQNKLYLLYACCIYTFLWLYGFFIFEHSGEIGPGGVKRIVAIYEGFHTRDAMTYLMSWFLISPKFSGLFLSYTGGIFICFASALLSKKPHVMVLMSAYPMVVWIALLHGPDAIALGMMWCAIALVHQRSSFKKLLSIWFFIWAYHLKITVLPLFFSCLPIFFFQTTQRFISYILTAVAMILIYILQVNPIWYMIVLMSSPIKNRRIRSDWILCLICLAYTIYYLGDKIRPRYIIPIETYFVYLSAIQIKKSSKMFYVWIGILCFLSIDQLHSWCNTFAKYDAIECPTKISLSDMSTLTHSDHSFVGHLELRNNMIQKDERGFLLPYLRDAREYHIRAWGYETQQNIVFMSQQNCCKNTESLETCSERLLQNIRQFGGTIIVPSLFNFERRIPPKHHAFIKSLQEKISEEDSISLQYWTLYTQKNISYTLPLPCQRNIYK